MHWLVRCSLWRKRDFFGGKQNAADNDVARVSTVIIGHHRWIVERLCRNTTQQASGRIVFFPPHERCSATCSRYTCVWMVIDRSTHRPESFEAASELQQAGPLQGAELEGSIPELQRLRREVIHRELWLCNQVYG